jgi:hypothetical protein
LKRLLLFIVIGALAAQGIAAIRPPVATETTAAETTDGNAGPARIPDDGENPGKNNDGMPPSWLPVLLAALCLAAFAFLLLWAEFLGRYHREGRKPPRRRERDGRQG